MQKTTTLSGLKLFFGKMFPVFVLMAFSVMKISAQPYVNGTLSTGTTTVSGVVSPTGYTWSECQNPTGNTTVANTTAGFGAQVANNNSVADDFTVPGGQGWNISKITVYAYSTGSTGSTSPFNDVRIRIHRGNPSLGPTTIVFGDLTTNRFSASSDALMYRNFNTVVTPATAPGTTRKIWKIEANVSVTLGPGVYWLEYQTGTVTAGASNFTPPSTPVGVRTLPGYNAIQSLAGTWAALTDPGQGPAASPVAVDFPFTVDYSIVAAPPCVAITSAVLSVPNQLISDGMEGTYPPAPAGWTTTNNSSPVGATGWTQGGPLGVFPSHSGSGFISANFNNVATAGTISNWLISPAITLRDGDQFTFWTRTTDGTFPDRLQVRMSTNGTSTNVGTGSAGLGDFTNLLLDINPTYTSTGYPTSWTQFTVTVSGVGTTGVQGRMAFRYFVENAGLLGTNSDFIGIDDIAYNSTSTPTVCSGASGNIRVNITGGVGPYTVVYNAAPGGNVTVNNYTSGANIPVTPTANTTYTLVSVTGLDGCTSPNNSGTGTINVTTGSTAAVLSQVLLPPVPTTLYNETFTTAIPLPAGWAQQNLSSPVGLTNWFQGNTAVFPANTPAGYIATNFNNTTGLNTISNWLFAPNVTMRNGDRITFYTRTTTGTFPDRLQVRMSTNGASVNAGASNTSVGDFTTLLLDINPTYTTSGYPTAWTQFSITLSGLPAGGVSGRIAFRYFVEGGGPLGNNSDYIGIDDVVYNTTVPGAPPTTCTGSTANLKVDITGGLSPYTVTITPTAPAGAPIVVSNYVSGTSIPVTPAVTTTYALTSVVSAAGCVGTGNSGTPTITVSATPMPPMTIVDDPTGPLCAGNPKLLTATNGPSVTTFTAAGTVEIPAAPTTSGIANPYPSNLVVSGLPTSGVTVKSVAINGFTHTFPVDVDILLQSPTGTNVVIMSDVGGTGAISNVNYVFDDAAPTAMTAAAAPAGTYKPSNVTTPDTWVAPGPGSVTQATPALSMFTGNFNGTWKLFAVDDVGGDAGTISGWNITFTAPSAAPVGYTYVWSPAAGLSSTTTNPVAASPMQTTTYQVLATAPSGCQTTAQITINVNQLPAVTAQPSNTTVCAGATATFTATGSGAGITYQWQVSTAGAGGPWTNVSGAPYSGETTTTLTINPVTSAMNGWRYRIVVSGTCPPSANSLGGILTVNPLPVITISPAGPVCGGVAGINATQLTASSPTGGNFTWSPATGLYTDATGGNAYIAGTPTATVYAAPGANTTYTVSATNPTTGCIGTGTVTVNYTPGAPVVTPASATICLGGIQQLSIAPLASTFNSGIVNIAIPDNTANGISHTIPVSGLTPGSINNIAVTLNITHTWVGDLVINLKAPNNSILALDKYLTATGGSAVTTGMTNTVISSQGVNPLSSGTNPWTATFKPDAINGTIAGPTVQNPAGFVSNATGFPDLYSQPNGNWTLAIADGGALDVGTLVSWSITLSYGAAPLGVWTPATGLYTDPAGSTPYIAGTPVQTVYASPAVSTTYAVTVANGTCTSPVRTVPVTVNTPLSISGQPANVATCTNGIATFTTVVSGTAPSHHWQVSSDNGNTWANISNGGVYSGAVTGTLTITNPLLSMNNYLYRDSVSTAPCGSIISAIATLTVNPLPVVTLSASPYTRLFPGLTTTISSSITPNAAATYTWRRNGVVVPGANGASLYVDADGVGLYTLTVNDVNGCGSSSNSILISDSVNTKLFIYPNPNTGRFQVRYYSVNANTLVRGLTVYNAAGQRVLVQQNSITAPYARMDVDMSKFGKGIYWVELGDQNGNRLAVGRVVIQ
jgi:subtilisin-like proprotein convertase family protein